MKYEVDLEVLEVLEAKERRKVVDEESGKKMEVNRNRNRDEVTKTQKQKNNYSSPVTRLASPISRLKSEGQPAVGASIRFRIRRSSADKVLDAAAMQNMRIDWMRRAHWCWQQETGH